MKRNTKRKNEGITLIALVITIIVLLILAGVTIATLTGDNGILTKATGAKKETEIAEVKERAQLDIASWVADKMQKGKDATVNTSDVVKNILDTANPDESNRYYKDVTDEGVITPNDYIVPISELYTNGTGYIQAGTEVEEKPSDWESTQVIAIADGQGGVIPLPNDFYYVGGTKSEGIVISDNSADEGKGTSHEVAQTLQGNQFVWVPIESEEDELETYEGYQNKSLQSYINKCEEPYSGGYADEETEYNQMKASIIQYNGFYVGRYEAGIEGTARIEGDVIDDEVVIKQGKNVYNYLGWSDSDDMTDETGGAVELSKKFDTERGYTSVTSTLIYGVQWDAIMAWIDPAYKTGSCTEDSFIRDSTGKGYYNQLKPTVTGSNKSYMVKNIYDLAGNCWEWTMESYIATDRVRRGGSSDNIEVEYPVSIRSSSLPSRKLETVGFRITLYI